jgi:hypothetical protein
MCHFYANPLSILCALPTLDPDALDEYISHIHLEMIRALPSMRNYVEEKLFEKDTDEVRSLLFDDEYLLSLLPQFVELLHNKAAELREAIIVLGKLSERDNRTRRGLTDLYLDVLGGEIHLQKPFVRDLLMQQKYPLSINLTQKILAKKSDGIPCGDN